MDGVFGWFGCVCAGGSVGVGGGEGPFVVDEVLALGGLVFVVGVGEGGPGAVGDVFEGGLVGVAGAVEVGEES